MLNTRVFRSRLTQLYPVVLNAKRYARVSPWKKELPPPPFEKRLDCVIMGTPNVGKSVLLNTLIKHKLAATSRKRHTTRGEILGAFNHRHTQLVFYDTPGYVTEREKQKEEFQVIRELADSTVEKADVVLLVVDASRTITENYRYVFGEMVKLALKHIKKEIILVLNKVDLVQPKTRLLETTRELVSLINGVKLGPENAHLAKLDTTTFMISALNNDGVLDLKNYLIRKADMKAWLVKEGITTLTPEEIVQEIILESLLDHTHEEIPYIADIECLSIKQLSASKVRIDVNIHLDSSRQAKIVIGEKGRTMLKIRQQSAEELEKIHKKTVLLFLWIKENKNGVKDT